MPPESWFTQEMITAAFKDLFLNLLLEDWALQNTGNRLEPVTALNPAQLIQ